MQERLLAELLSRATDDWLQACEVAEVAKFIGGATTDAEIRTMSISLIQELACRGLMDIGDVTERGFEAWRLDPLAAVSQVKEAWEAIEGVPSLGEVCWLNLTKKGERLAESLMD